MPSEAIPVREPDTSTLPAAPVAPVAAFTSPVQSGTAPLTVMFSDQSTNSPTSWKWEYKKTDGSWTSFGSGARTRRTSLPPVSMTSDLRQQMPLEAILLREPDTSTFPQPRSLRLQHLLPQSGREQLPLTVRFTDQSTNAPTSWKWEYKKTDGSWTVFGSGAQNPTNIFAAGTYDIRLTATNTAGNGISSKTGYIIVAAPVPHCCFHLNVQTVAH